MKIAPRYAEPTVHVLDASKSVVVVSCNSLESFRNDDGNAEKKVAWKETFALLWLFCNYSPLFKWRSVGELRYNWTGGAPLKYKQKIKNLLLFAQVAVKNGNVVISRCCFANGNMELF